MKILCILSVDLVEYLLFNLLWFTREKVNRKNCLMLISKDFINLFDDNFKDA